MYNIALLLGNGPGFWDYITSLFSTIPKIMYLLWVAAMNVLDILQMFMRKLAGLDVYYNAAGDEKVGDIVINFLYGVLGVNGVQYPALNAAFWALIALSIVLLVLFTVVAIIKAQYLPSEAKKAAPLPIVGKAIRAIGEFALVPLTCIIAMWLCNIILIGLDSATQFQLQEDIELYKQHLEPYSYKGPLTADEGNGVYRAYDFFGINDKSMGSAIMPFSGQVFMTAAYKANRVRAGFYNADGSGWDTRGGFLTQNTLTTEDVASRLDYSFANHFKLKSGSRLSIGGTGGSAKFCLFSGVDIFHTLYFIPLKSFSKYNVAHVWYYYDLWKFDFLVGFAALVVMLSLFVNIIFGLAKRIFEMTGLFVIVPPIIAMRPLDDGGALKKWRDAFQKKALMAYGTIVGMNVMMLILPYVNDIKFFDPDIVGMSVVNNLISSIMVIVGLVSVKGFMDICDGLIGGASAAGEGEAVAKATGSTLAKAGALTAGAAAVGMKGMSMLNPAAMGIQTGARAAGKGIAGAMGRKSQAKKDKATEGERDDLNDAQADLATAEADHNNLFGGNKVDAGISDKYNKARQEAIHNGATAAQAKNMADAAVKDDLDASGHADMNALYAAHGTNSSAASSDYRKLRTAQKGYDSAKGNLDTASSNWDSKHKVRAGMIKMGDAAKNMKVNKFKMAWGKGDDGKWNGWKSMGGLLGAVGGFSKDVAKEYGSNSFTGKDGFGGLVGISGMMDKLIGLNPSKMLDAEKAQKDANEEAERRYIAEIKAGIRNPDGSMR